jgi:5-methyltetrahydropteroyltriglutamate--homocysteine methyltransferase
MKRSTDRILTTHSGGLPKPQSLRELITKRSRGEALESGETEEAISAAVTESVRRQIEVGVDIIDDGEQSKSNFISYVTDRLDGFERRHAVQSAKRSRPWTVNAGLIRHREAREPFSDDSAPPHFRGDIAEFHDFARSQPGASAGDGWVTVRPITLKDPSAVRTDLANLQAAIDASPSKPVDVFMPALSPGQFARIFRNDYYAGEEELMQAVADAMHDEYKAIIDAGYVLQLDCPDLASGASSDYLDASVQDFRKVIERHVEAVNYAIKGLPQEQIRIHLCWGNYEGPHHRDIALRDVIDIALKCDVAGFSIEGANPRHQHEWQVWEDVKLPEGKVLIPGVIDDKTNFIEHPELVAERIVRYARLVGRENVIATPDCGFSGGRCSPEIAWAKLHAMAEGARLASTELWK